MTCEIRWRRAVIVSVLFHILLLGSSGYIAARLFTATAVAEPYVELNLVSEPEIETQTDNGITADPQPAPDSALQPRAYEHADNVVSNPVPSRNKTVTASNNPMSSAAAENSPAAGGNEPAGIPAGPAGSGSTGSNDGSSGSAGSSSKSGVAPPAILSKVEPPYPESARQGGIEGTVVLKVQILENGRPGSIAVVRSSGHDILDDSAVAAVTEWRFIPARDRDSGRAVACYTTIPVSFRLNS